MADSNFPAPDPGSMQPGEPPVVEPAKPCLPTLPTLPPRLTKVVPPVSALHVAAGVAASPSVGTVSPADTAAVAASLEGLDAGAKNDASDWQPDERLEAAITAPPLREPQALRSTAWAQYLFVAGVFLQMGGLHVVLQSVIRGNETDLALILAAVVSLLPFVGFVAWSAICASNARGLLRDSKLRGKPSGVQATLRWLGSAVAPVVAYLLVVGLWRYGNRATGSAQGGTSREMFSLAGIVAVCLFALVVVLSPYLYMARTAKKASGDRSPFYRWPWITVLGSILIRVATVWLDSRLFPDHRLSARRDGLQIAAAMLPTLLWQLLGWIALRSLTESVALRRAVLMNRYVADRDARAAASGTEPAAGRALAEPLAAG